MNITTWRTESASKIYHKFPDASEGIKWRSSSRGKRQLTITHYRSIFTFCAN
jgi:hypothetical protein